MACAAGADRAAGRPRGPIPPRCGRCALPTLTWERLAPSRRDAVIAAAEAEFGAHGFSGGSLNVIARNAGVAKGSLFQYFADKADLYAHLSELASARIRAALEPVIDSLPWGESFFGALGTLVAAWIAYFDTHPLERGVTAAVNLEPDPAARSAVREVVNRHYLAVLGPLIERGRRGGQLRAGSDVEAMMALLLLVMPHLALAGHSPGLDPVLGMNDGDTAARLRAGQRLVDALALAFAAVPPPAEPPGGRPAAHGGPRARRAASGG